eukprot:CAMPEP_0197073034 /NCGR_PEP_ID=MMETSP1384-20130603/210398_1 /TAXON_ID=29189 /ORGANISM="Ammonia sp." /LENGTH=523 /DNA_ID=CAMNT_0042511859 /DNA_START=95 /DNA_END=1667 /DNA_ORIENTATION=-
MADRYSAAELAAACGLTEMEAAECIAQFDEDGDGTLAAQDFEDLKSQIIAQQQASGGDGRLSAEELAAACNITPMEAQNIIMQYDADGDGTLNSIIAQQQADGGDGRLSAARDAYIEELAAACNITPMEAQNIIMQYDADGDGTLNPDEFEDLKQQILAQQREHLTDNLSHNDFHDAMDADGDGKLTAEELAAACNITPMEAQNIITQYDADGDGMLNPDEFEDLKQQILKQQREAAAQQIDENTNFQQMDDNKDNRLSAKELAAACNITELQASNLIQQYDVNNDGYLNEEEFDTLKQQILKEQAAKLQQERQQRQAEQNAQYNANKNAAAASGGDDAVQEFKHKWKFGMNFDPKNENVVIYASNLIQQYDVNNDGYLNEEEFDTLKQQILKEQAAKLQQERQQRQAEQNAQYNANKNAAAASGGDDAVQEFKHKWKFGMNFDPKNENVVIYVSDEVTSKNWGTTLKKNDFNGPIRQEYRKLGGVISSGTIKYDYPKQGGPLQVHIMGKNGEEYHYSCPQQM